MKKSHFINLLLAGLLVFGTVGFATAAPKANPEKDVYFGTTHGHSSWSIDAFALGNQKYGPEDGYRFARGEAVTHMGGPKVQLKLPLDFFMMTDHSEFMGAAPMFLEKGSMVYDTPVAKLVREKKKAAAFQMIAGAIIIRPTPTA